MSQELEHAATVDPDWSSLPGDIVRNVAGFVGAPSDIDYYMDFRAVCSSWRSATDDPKNTFNHRFCPRWWIVIDDLSQSQSDGVVLVNTLTGRFLRKKLPMLRHFYIVATTPAGLFVLADRTPPHAARVLNSLTGHLIRFAAPVPPEVGLATVGSDDDGSPTLVLISDSSRRNYMADPASKCFSAGDNGQGSYNLLRKAVIGDVYGDIARLGAPELCRLFSDLGHLNGLLPCMDIAKFFSDDPVKRGRADDIRCSLVDLCNHTLLVVKLPTCACRVFRLDADEGALQPLRSIGRHSIFVGHQRCIAVNAEKFPCVEANCVYYTEHFGSYACIRKCNIADSKDEAISIAADFVKQDKHFVLVAARPFTTVVHLLSSYTMNVHLLQTNLLLPTLGILV